METSERGRDIGLTVFGYVTIEAAQHADLAAAHDEDDARSGGVGCEGDGLGGATGRLAALAQQRGPLVVQERVQVRERDLDAAGTRRGEARLRCQGDRAQRGLPQTGAGLRRPQPRAVLGQGCTRDGSWWFVVVRT